MAAVPRTALARTLAAAAATAASPHAGCAARCSAVLGAATRPRRQQPTASTSALASARRWASTTPPGVTPEQASDAAEQQQQQQHEGAASSSSSSAQLTPDEPTFAAEAASDASADAARPAAAAASAPPSLDDILGSALSTGPASDASPSSSPSSPPSRPRLTGSADAAARPGTANLHRLHIHATRNNTLLTFTNPSGETLASATGGTAGFKKSQRSGYEAGYRAAFQIFARIADYRRSLGFGIGAPAGSPAALRQGKLVTLEPRGNDVNLETIWYGFGQGREAVFRALMTNEGSEIRSLVRRITDGTPLKIGGVRPKKRRML